MVEKPTDQAKDMLSLLSEISQGVRCHLFLTFSIRNSSCEPSGVGPSEQTLRRRTVNSDQHAALRWF